MLHYKHTPLFQQHYLGRWVIDDSKLVYRYAIGRNDFDGLLPALLRGRWHFVLGIDLGYNDPTAFVVCAYNDFDPTLYVLEVFKEAKLDVTDVAIRARAYQARFDFDAMVIDGSNKQAVEEMRRRHGLALVPADKRGKSDFIELMNGEFVKAQIKLAPKAQALSDEYANLVWDERSAKREEHPGCENHLADAALYAWRHCYAYLSQKPQEPPKFGTPEWEDAEEQALSDRIEEEQRLEQEAALWH